MLLYLDANCFNRPFDDQGQQRIREETEAVLNVLRRILAGDDDLVWSSALTFELSAHPESEIREQLLAWSQQSVTTVTTAVPIRDRVDELVQGGLKPLDAAHAACAEAARCEFFLTCDDTLLRKASALARSVRAMNPVQSIEEVSDAGVD